MIEWMIKWMNEWLHEWLNEWLNEWMIEFIDSIHWSRTRNIVVYPKLASGRFFHKKHKKDSKQAQNGPQAENAKCKTIIKWGEHFSRSQFDELNFANSDNPQRIFKTATCRPGGPPLLAADQAVLILCSNSLIAPWEPLRVNSVRGKTRI